MADAPRLLARSAVSGQLLGSAESLEEIKEQITRQWGVSSRLAKQFTKADLFFLILLIIFILLVPVPVPVPILVVVVVAVVGVTMADSLIVRDVSWFWITDLG